MIDYEIIAGVPFVKCPRCGAEIKEGIPLCPKCNTPIEWDEVHPIHVFVSECPKCGEQIDAFIDKCTHCGAELIWDKPEHEKLRKERDALQKVEEVSIGLTGGGFYGKKGRKEEQQPTQQPPEPVLKFKCPNCGTIVTGKPPKCPGCGAPFIWD